MTADEYVEAKRFEAHLALKGCSNELDFGIVIGLMLKVAFEAGQKQNS